MNLFAKRRTLRSGLRRWLLAWALRAEARFRATDLRSRYY
jgi:hypothetical protein